MKIQINKEVKTLEGMIVTNPILVQEVNHRSKMNKIVISYNYFLNLEAIENKLLPLSISSDSIDNILIVNKRLDIKDIVITGETIEDFISRISKEDTIQKLEELEYNYTIL